MADVVIHYCELCHLRPTAQRIADELQRDLGIHCELRTAFWGTFRIESHGAELYNRWKTRGFLGRIGFGRLPLPGEVTSMVRKHLASSEPPLVSS